MNASTLGFGVVVILTSCTVGAACSSTKSDSAGTSTSTAAAVIGAQDSHCTGKPTITTSQAACTATPDTGDAGEGDAGVGPTSDVGETMFNSEGDDDDCKYHVKWQATAVPVNSDVTFAVTTTKKADNSPLTGAEPEVEVFLDEAHPAPNSAAKTVETSPGNYTIGPVRFDAAGKWTVRFHFFDKCNDSEESPHGHAAFFVKVP
jgi:hypothetical protein